MAGSGVWPRSQLGVLHLGQLHGLPAAMELQIQVRGAVEFGHLGVVGVAGGQEECHDLPNPVELESQTAAHVG